MEVKAWRWRAVILAFALVLYARPALGSFGDHLPEFKECLEVCRYENCGPDKAHTPIPLLHKLLFWSCSSECDYTCQHIVTDSRIAVGEPVVQFHGKWPFSRFLGMQEPFSVLFSLGNLWAHWSGLKKLQVKVPSSYPLRSFYEWFARIGVTSWVFSSLFHTRDFRVTEELDYFAAGATILYGLYYATVRIFRLDRPTPRKRSVLRAWTLLCSMLFIGHVAYMKGVRWNYTYNMMANVVIGVLQNSLWSWFSVQKYRKSGRVWTTWPGIAVAWMTFAMSMELFDFPPWLGCIDAHSLWHLFTIVPIIIWYNFLVKDALDDLAGSERLKA